MKGLLDDAASRRDGKRKLIEEACTAVAASGRPSSLSVFKQGAGAFSLSAVSSPKRHLDIVKSAQAKWDNEHGATPKPGAYDVGRAEGNGVRGEQNDVSSQSPPDEVNRAQRPEEAMARGTSAQARAEAAEAAAARTRVQLDAALQLIEEQDAKLRQNEKEKAQLRLDLERARAEPRPRLRKVYRESDGEDARH